MLLFFFIMSLILKLCLSAVLFYVLSLICLDSQQTLTGCLFGRICPFWNNFWHWPTLCLEVSECPIHQILSEIFHDHFRSWWSSESHIYHFPDIFYGWWFSLCNHPFPQMNTSVNSNSISLARISLLCSHIRCCVTDVQSNHKYESEVQPN